jgi:hypothetical protein
MQPTNLEFRNIKNDAKPWQQYAATLLSPQNTKFTEEGEGANHAVSQIVGKQQMLPRQKKKNNNNISFTGKIWTKNNITVQ